MFEGIFQPAHLLLIMAIAAILFGPKKIPELGRGLGEAIRGFREAFHATPDHVEVAKPSSDQPAAIAAAPQSHDLLTGSVNAVPESAGLDGVNGSHSTAQST